MPIIWIAWLMGIPIKKRIGGSDFLVDQAGWHMSTRLVVPANVTIITLPPKCPELNPVENVWQYIWLSNRIFKSHDDLVDHCCEAWNKLVDQPWRIMSLGLRQWAHEF